MSYWLENGMRRDPLHTIVDLGYWNDEGTPHRFDRIMELVSRRNAEMVGNGRAVVRIPPTKVVDALKAIPEIKEGAAGYCWCTHGWIEPAPASARSTREDSGDA